MTKKNSGDDKSEIHDGGVMDHACAISLEFGDMPDD